MRTTEQRSYLFEELPPLAFTDGLFKHEDDDLDCQSTKHRHHRSIWISDVHLGSKSAKAKQLSDFLRHNSCDTLYLVGDIIDGWKMKKHAFWPRDHIRLVQQVLNLAKNGTHVVYVTGNHDEFLRNYSGTSFGNVHLVDEIIHFSPAGEKFWVVHGDGYERDIFNKPSLVVIGDFLYDLLLKLNPFINRLRQSFGKDYWSLSGYIKNQSRRLFGIVTNYQNVLVKEGKKRSVDGVICGHIHFPIQTEIDGFKYANCGDWVESCSALTEDFQGRMEIVKWPYSTSISKSKESESFELPDFVNNET